MRSLALFLLRSSSWQDVSVWKFLAQYSEFEWITKLITRVQFTVETVLCFLVRRYSEKNVFWRCLWIERVTGRAQLHRECHDPDRAWWSVRKGATRLEKNLCTLRGWEHQAGGRPTKVSKSRTDGEVAGRGKPTSPAGLKPGSAHSFY